MIKTDPTSQSMDSSSGRPASGLLNFRSWTIGRRVAMGFALVILAAAGLGAFALIQVRSLGVVFTSVSDDNIPSLELIGKVEQLATKNRLLVFKHISSGNREDMQNLELQFAENSRLIGEALKDYAGRAGSAEDRAIVDAIQNGRVEYLKKSHEVLEKSRTEKSNELTYVFARAELDPAGVKYAVALDAAAEHEKQCVAESVVGFKKSVTATERGVETGLTLALLLGVIVGFGINRSTARVLRSVSDSLADGASQVASSSHQVSAASQALAEGSSEQAASLEETGSSLEEMASMTRRNSESTVKANELATQARQAADAGAADMKAMQLAMGDIKTSGDDIAKIIKTIDEIAFQTNILALNAAVEAARAGTAGAGFAVVADEVRALAQRSAQASKETSDKIEGSLAKTAQGVAISERVGRSLTEIVDKVRQVDRLISEVSTASREQSQGVDQINAAVSQMDKVVQSSASSAEETAAAAEELNAQAQVMRESVSDLMALVGGSSARRSGTEPARQNRHSVSAERQSVAKVSHANLGKRNFLPRATPAFAGAGDSSSLTFKDF